MSLHRQCPFYPKFCACRLCVCGMAEHTVTHDTSLMGSHAFRGVKTKGQELGFKPHMKRGSLCKVGQRTGMVLHHYFSYRHNAGFVNVMLDSLKWPHTYNEEFVELTANSPT